jgi:hypothetical protein
VSTYLPSVRGASNDLQLQVVNLLYLIVTVALISIGLASVLLVKIVGVPAD